MNVVKNTGRKASPILRLSLTTTRTPTTTSDASSTTGAQNVDRTGVNNDWPIPFNPPCGVRDP